MNNQANFKSFILLLFWIMAIWIVSSLPGKVFPQYDNLSFDKLIHFFEYAIAGILLDYNQRKGVLSYFRRYDVLMLLVVLTCLDEAHQIFIPNRSVSVLDLAANLTGVLAGYHLSGLWKRKKYD